MSTFLRPKKGSRTWQKQQRESTASSQPTALYHFCSQLPLDIFIECLVDSNYTRLAIKGTPSAKELAAAWDAIHIEYLELNQGNETIYSIRLQSEISLLSDEIQRVEEIIFLLSPAMLPLCGGREQELVDMLRYYGYKQTIDFNSDYTRTLNAIKNRLNPKKLRLDARINELTDYMKTQASGKPDRKVFETNLTRMSRFQGYPIRAKDITVSEYVMIFKDCIEANPKKEGKE